MSTPSKGAMKCASETLNEGDSKMNYASLPNGLEVPENIATRYGFQKGHDCDNFGHMQEVWDWK